jgi:hypothetical protein
LNGFIFLPPGSDYTGNSKKAETRTGNAGLESGLLTVSEVFCTRRPETASKPNEKIDFYFLKV